MSETQAPAALRTNAEMFDGGKFKEGNYWCRTDRFSTPQVVFVQRDYGKTTLLFHLWPKHDLKSFCEMYPDAQWGERLAPFGGQ